MSTLTMQQRADAYAASEFGRRFPESVPRVSREQERDVLYAIWVIGNDYRNPSRYYGSYPRGYLERLMALFPDVTDPQTHCRYRGPGWLPTLHAFAGSVPPGHYIRCDVQGDVEARCSVLELPERYGRDFFLQFADPPYSGPDAEKYGTPMVDRRRCTAALAQVAQPGGFLCWLDTCWPMHSKRQWVTVGRIFVQRSTNHRVRLLSIFRRVEDIQCQ